MIKTKVCNGECGLEKNVGEFGKRARGGYRSECKICVNKKTAAYKKANREKVLEANAKYRDEHKIEAYEYYKNNEDRIKEVNAEWRRNNPEKVKGIRKRGWENLKISNPEAILAYNKHNCERRKADRSDPIKLEVIRKKEHERWEKDSQDPVKAAKAKERAKARRERDKLDGARMEVVRAQKRKYKQNNPEVAVADAGKRRATKLSATPAFFDQKEIRKLCKLAQDLTRQTGIKHHVDHIVPLVSKYVSGLHWHGNLQVIPEKENLSKGNRYWPDMWDYEKYPLDL